MGVLIYHWFFKKILFIYFQRGREGEKEGEKPQCVVASHAAPTGGPALNPGMCPDQESNRNRLVRSLALNPLSHTSQGLIYSFSLNISPKYQRVC